MIPKSCRLFGPGSCDHIKGDMIPKSCRLLAPGPCDHVKPGTSSRFAWKRSRSRRLLRFAACVVLAARRSSADLRDLGVGDHLLPLGHVGLDVGGKLGG